jgi:hypothetical protein
MANLQNTDLSRVLHSTRFFSLTNSFVAETFPPLFLPQILASIGSQQKVWQILGQILQCFFLGSSVLQRNVFLS